MPRAVNGYKQCCKCLETKPVSAFGKQACRFDGLEYLCLDCSRSRKREYKVRNRDKVLQSMKIYNQTDIAKQGRSQYKKTAKGKLAVAKLNAKRREFNKKVSEFSFDEYEFILRLQGNCCACCGKEFNQKLKPEIDHVIPVSKGGVTSFSNVQLLCRSCNARKSNKNIRYIPEVIMTSYV